MLRKPNMVSKSILSSLGFAFGYSINNRMFLLDQSPKKSFLISFACPITKIRNFTFSYRKSSLTKVKSAKKTFTWPTCTTTRCTSWSFFILWRRHRRLQHRRRRQPTFTCTSPTRRERQLLEHTSW